MNTGTQAQGARWATRGMFTAAVAVACAAGVTTAHGLYEVAVAAEIPPRIAWLYPVITDGLALVAYAATSRLSGAGRRYAWMVVVLAAGLSGWPRPVTWPWAWPARQLSSGSGSGRGRRWPPRSWRTCCSCSAPATTVRPLYKPSVQ